MLNFGGLDKEFTNPDQAKIVIVPVPYDETSTWIKGADRGPGAIVRASENMELYDIETDTEVFREGIHTSAAILDVNSPDELVRKVEDNSIKWIDQHKFLVHIGGNHSISIGAFKAFANQFENLTILQFDAHADLRQEYEGSHFNHACVMARAMELCPVLQVGIRSMSVEEKKVVDRDRLLFCHEIISMEGWKDWLLNKLTENVYITIDLDVFDPSLMPSTGTPEPGGLNYDTLLNMMKKVNDYSNIVGFDIVELCPNELNKAPDFTAAKLIYQLLSIKFFKKEQR